MSKKIQIGAKPTAAKAADEWVTSRNAPAAEPVEAAEKMKRLTIDVSASLHREVKSLCADLDMRMADVTRELLSEWVQKHRKP